MARSKIDRFGRILIPKEIRRNLGIEDEVEVEVEVRGGKILIAIEDRDLKKRVEELIDHLKNRAPKPFVSDTEVEGKWYSAEFSMRKLGLKE
ncbi:looped-hinge helix DNA binding domain, AbrB family [Geoglobus ahangari]|uniref:Looped-hinge helix DNA binding domain, AbrB family n=1 Tax=Geoglobus ahangari TaxID=113653 RepID=A0A0F7IF67_9EURY|nr:AbrB/MazE/SpoVT family DNA-binding domain-containing protein [Geoglobus ahangari]AKG91373.1 looped-hinge helix DNA binding domain, AbrB family [Geoglobus ahangari]